MLGLVTYGTGEDIPGVDAGTVIGAEGIVQWGKGLPRRLLKGEEILELPRQRDLDTVLLECQAFIDEIRGRRDPRPTLDLDLRVLKAVSEAQANAEQKDKRPGREH